MKFNPKNTLAVLMPPWHRGEDIPAAELPLRHEVQDRLDTGGDMACGRDVLAALAGEYEAWRTANGYGAFDLEDAPLIASMPDDITLRGVLARLDQRRYARWVEATS